MVRVKKVSNKMISINKNVYLEILEETKTKYRALRKLGIFKYNAYMVANTRMGYYWVASTVVLHIAISNKRLNKEVWCFH